MSGPIEVRVEKHFRHPPERVFDAFLDSARVGEWLFATPGGVMEKTDHDPRPGGTFAIFERRGGELARHWGEFIEIDRPRRIVFTFRVEEASAGSTRVTVRFDPAGQGCDVTLTHDLEPEWAAYRNRSVAGWSLILDGLERVEADPR